RRSARKARRSLRFRHGLCTGFAHARAMDAAATTLLRLNLETQSHHPAADRLWAPLLVPNVTKWQYVAGLAHVYGFDAPLEAALAYTPDLRLAIDLRARIRAGLVAQDL